MNFDIMYKLMVEKKGLKIFFLKLGNLYVY